jgi:GNAT superfamily N-acetyltransferase
MGKILYQIRPAKFEDAPLLPLIEQSAGALFRSDPDLAWIADDEGQSAQRHAELIADGAAWVATDSKSAPVAFLNGEEIGGCFHIWEMSVHKDHQRHGLGSQLISHARQYAIEKGYPALTLTTFRGVAWNDAFYHRLGFELVEGEKLSNDLKAILADETKVGLPPERRCAMIMPLAGSS